MQIDSLSDPHGVEGNHTVSSPMERPVWQEQKPPASTHMTGSESRLASPVKLLDFCSLNSQLDCSSMRELSH